MRFKIVFVAVFINCLLGQIAFGQQDSEEVEYSESQQLHLKPQQGFRKGMRYIDAIRIFGAPLERIEREARREEVWQYKGFRIFFSEGAANAWVETDAVGVEATPVPTPLASPTPEGNTGGVGENAPRHQALEKLLGEILSEAPSEGENNPNQVGGSPSRLQPPGHSQVGRDRSSRAVLPPMPPNAE